MENNNYQNELKNTIHDLKIPITSIMGFVELLKKGTYNQKSQNEFLDIIYSESQRLLDLVEELLISSDKCKYSQGINKCNVNIQINKYVKALSPLASKKNVEVIFNVDSNDIYVSIPENKISRIITNILENAIKYNKEQGKVYINVVQKNDKVNIKIKDTGMGIAENELDKIFAKNYRSASAKNLSIPGSGLGLSIAKNFAEEYGGSIDVKSKIGEGTEFTVCFPEYNL
ncbi:MAG: HAMP domain-containing sensor histidine kinase [Clostridia bacterium]|nr:HAMP domain-containing sensor histidine kinase [Clostridia bacterium]